MTLSSRSCKIVGHLCVVAGLFLLWRDIFFDSHIRSSSGASSILSHFSDPLMYQVCCSVPKLSNCSSFPLFQELILWRFHHNSHDGDYSRVLGNIEFSRRWFVSHSTICWRGHDLGSLRPRRLRMCWFLSRWFQNYRCLPIAGPDRYSDYYPLTFWRTDVVTKIAPTSFSLHLLLPSAAAPAMSHSINASSQVWKWISHFSWSWIFHSS